MASLTRILSIDGGGIRGIIPGQILVTIERKLKQYTQDEESSIVDYFDLIAGTSTGGILTCIYLLPDTEKNQRPKFSAEDAVSLYLNRGKEIFQLPFWQKLFSMFGLLNEKYKARNLENALGDYFGEHRLSELLKPCLITSYDIEQRKTEFFTQHDAKLNKEQDYRVKDVARATSAAPTYFEVAGIKSMSDTRHPMIDGGVFANNPTLCAYAEARTKLENKPTAKDMAILSLGTGFVRKEYNYQDAKGWGAIKWIRPLIDIMMTGVSETVDYQLRQIFDAVGRGEQYLRINGELEHANPKMDDISSKNLQALKEEGTRIAKKFEKDIDKFIELIIN